METLPNNEGNNTQTRHFMLPEKPPMPEMGYILLSC